jgi:aminoglycoside phosphotransferase family enzyme
MLAARSFADRPSRRRDSADGTELDEIVGFLSDPQALGETAGAVEVIETHWSWVFLTPTRVFKLKKPLWRPWLDLSTREARRANCKEELRLNRRLTDGIYNRVVPLCRAPNGALMLGGGGVAVDWLLEMERLPADRMLDALLRHGKVSGGDVNDIGRRLAAFYASLRPVVADGRLYLEHLRTEAAENRRVLEAADVRLSPAAIGSVLDRVDRLLVEATPAIEDRVADGRIVEGHGDLRPEHVCLIDPVQIFDCLEFDRSMRILDPFDEVNYLGLECAFIGARWIRPHLIAILDDTIGGQPSPKLMTFYSAFRATLRARICLAHLDDEVPMEPERWPLEARAYLRLAQAELSKLQ